MQPKVAAFDFLSLSVYRENTSSAPCCTENVKIGILKLKSKSQLKIVSFYLGTVWFFKASAAALEKHGMISGCMGSPAQVPFSQGLPSSSDKGDCFCMTVHSTTCRPQVLKRLWLSTAVRWDGLLLQEAGGQAKYSLAFPTCLLPALIGVHPLFSGTAGRATVLLKRVKVPFSRSLHTLLLAAWRAKDRKAGSGSYHLHYCGFPLHPHLVSACSPSGRIERELVCPSDYLTLTQISCVLRSGGRPYSQREL